MIEKNKNRVRKNQFKFYYNDDEKITLAEKLTLLKYSNRSKYFRDLISNNFMYVNLYRELLNEFRKQGNNLNQVAKYCNENKQADDVVAPTLKNIEIAYKEILKELKNR